MLPDTKSENKKIDDIILDTINGILKKQLKEEAFDDIDNIHRTNQKLDDGNHCCNIQ